MIVQIWLIYKKGEPRIYTRTTEIPDVLAAEWRRQGFKIFFGHINLPIEEGTQVDNGFCPPELVEWEDGDT